MRVDDPESGGHLSGWLDAATLLGGILDASADPIWAVDLDFAVVAFNRAAADLCRERTGLTLCVGQTDAGPAEPAERWRALYERALAEGRIVVEREVFGDVVLELTLSPLSRDGQACGVLVISRDVTAQRHTETSLRQREAFFRKVLEDAGDITSVLARDGRRMYISSGVTRMLGFTEAEGLALKMAESTHPEDQARLRSTFLDLLAKPDSRARIRFRQRHKDGSYRIVDAFVRNACEDPDVRGVVVNTRDVTDQVQLEQQFQQAQKLESVGRLAGGVAHDFNNLLTIILSCGEILRGETTREEQTEYVDEIVAAAQRARDLTRQLLAFARKQVVAPVPLDLTGQVQGSEKMLRRLVGEDVLLNVKAQEGLWPVLCDPGQLDQVLFNLVVNARDAMPGGGAITIETENIPGQGGARDEVRLSVHDTGCGISAGVLEHIFEPFFTTKPSGAGTGLGLATVHGIVQQHGGRVRVESAVGAGTTFEIRFPRSEARARAGEHGTETAPGTGEETILLVEDDAVVQKLATAALRKGGYRVIAASDGQEALHLLARLEGPLDLVITDIVMPHLDGRRLAEAVRHGYPTLPVLFTSGYTADRLTSDGLLPPDIDLLPKPFTPSTLLERVRVALDRARGEPRRGSALGGGGTR